MRSRNFRSGLLTFAENSVLSPLSPTRTQLRDAAKVIDGDTVSREHGAVADLKQRGRFGIYGSEEHAAGASSFLGWPAPADRVGGANTLPAPFDNPVDRLRTRVSCVERPLRGAGVDAV